MGVRLDFVGNGREKEKEVDGEWGLPRMKTRSARPRGMCGDRGMLMTGHQVEVDWWNTATERRKGKMVY